MHLSQSQYPTGAAVQLANGQLIGVPQGQTQQVLTTSNGISYISGQPQQSQQQMIANNGLSPQVLQQLQQHLCSQNVISQPTTQYIISTQGSAAGTAISAIPPGYQAVQTAGGQQVLIPVNHANQQQIAPQTVNQNNQYVQLLLSNGQVMTTTLANLQAMGLTAQTQAVSAATPHQYSSVQPNGNVIVSGTQTGTLPPQTQLVTNSAGQVFAITPQMTNQSLQPQAIVSQNQTNATTTQYIQMVNGQPVIQQVVTQPQQVVNNAALLQQIEESKALVHQQLIQQHQQQQQQQQLALQQQKQSDKQTKSSESTTQTTRSSNSPNSSNSQTIVSSTTSRPQSINSSLNQENTSQSSEASEIKTDRISVQSQTSSPSSSNSTMEAESTTHCNLPNKDTINNTDANIVDGINLEEIKEFAKVFKIRRLSLGLTQTQVGQSLSATEGPSYSQSAICRFEKLDITPKSAQKIKPVLENWMKEAEERYKNGTQTLTEFMGNDSSKKRKRRTSFTPSALEILNLFFEKNTHPTGSEMTELAEQLNYDREVVRVWFCNKRQALRNTNKKVETSFQIL